MVSILESIAGFLFAWIAIAVTLSFFIALLYPWIRSWLLNFPASSRSTLSLSIVLSPHLIAAMVLFLFSHPELNHLLVESHCHGNKCGPHWLYMPAATVGGMSVVFFAIFVLLIVVAVNLRKFLLNRSYLKMLDSFSDEAVGTRYRLVETAQPMAWCVGFFNPQVYLSRGLLEQLDAKQLKTVLDHESSHALHYDNLRKLLLHWSSIPWPKAKREQLRADVVFDIESRCDLEAALKSDHQDVLSTVAVIKEFCDADSHQEVVPVAKRADGLERELACYIRSANDLWLQRAQMGFTLMAFWVVFTVLSARFGHHLLEWLSR